MKEILNTLKQPHDSVMPSDEELLQELKQKEWIGEDRVE